MAKFSRQTWYWIGGLGIGGILISLAFFLFFAFYNPLVLINKISNQDVVGYLEWQRVDAVNIEALPSLPFITALKNKLPCQLVECDFWGASSAIVLRNRNEKIIPELYLYRPFEPSLNDTWQKIASSNGRVTLGSVDYELRWYDDIAVISPNPLTTVGKVNTIADMPWLRESDISSWGQRWGSGYCAISCLNWLSASTVQASDFVFFPAFLNSTIRFIEFGLYPRMPFRVEYQLFFTDQYQHSLSERRVFRDLTLSPGDRAGFSGENFSSKMRMLEGNSQNAGLWQTVQSLWSTAPTGEAWWKIITSIGNYPYAIYLGNELKQTRLELDIPASERKAWKETLEQNIEQYASILFPKIVHFTLPDGTLGAEYSKNTSLTTTWEKENSNDLLVVRTSTGAQVFKLYVLEAEESLILSVISPIRISSSETACLQSERRVEEFSVYHFPNIPFYMWHDITESSTQVVRGNVYFDNQNHSC